jgi:hypothetical protein
VNHRRLKDITANLRLPLFGGDAIEAAARLSQTHELDAPKANDPE